MYRELLPGSLQVDLAFSPESEFRATGPSFHLVFGLSAKEAVMPSQSVRQIIGWGALYLLHAHASINRERWWQAEYFVRGFRDYVLALACRRLGKEWTYGRGYDELPQDVLARFKDSLVHCLESEELKRALSLVSERFFQEARLADPDIVALLEAASLPERGVLPNE